VLAVPAVAWYAAFFLAPLVFPLYFSFGVSQGQGGPNIGGFPSLENYQRLGEQEFLDVFLNTLRMAFLGTVALLMLAFPMAYFLATRAGRWKFVLLTLFIVPYWTSFLIRTYSWQILLSSNGPPNAFLEYLGLIDEPLDLLFSPFAVWLGLVYNYLPLMVIALFVTLERMDRSLVEAAKDLGAGRVATFRKVTLPLALPGVLAGAILVFVPLSGEYIVPTLLGGGKSIFIGNVIVQQFGAVRDWAFGATLGIGMSVVILAVVGCVTLGLRGQLRRVA